jgi:SAM-dependent methyltransferase
MPMPCPLCDHDGVATLARLDGALLVRCRACRLAYRDPLRRVAEIRNEYDGVYAERDIASRLDTRRQRIFADFLTRVSPAAGQRLLDVGCGTGSFLDLARAAGWLTSGVELSPEGAAVARGRGHDVYDASASVAGGSMDAVTLWNVLDYFEAPLPALRDLHRVLRPGGTLFIRTPSETFQLTAYRVSRVVRRPPALARLLAQAFYFHSLVWNPRTLRTAVERAGFVDFAAWPSTPSAGDPYHARPRALEAAVDLTKRAAYIAARAAALLSRGRVALGTSIVALARKPFLTASSSLS